MSKQITYGTALVADLIGTFIRSAIVMVAARYVHENGIAAIPAFGYWTALVLHLGVENLFGGVKIVKDWREGR